ncbi:MAG: hypothetical protein HRT35_09910 [Algicola sp.]|nr:hypothetical protein [Algicola sp.]
MTRYNCFSICFILLACAPLQVFGESIDKAKWIEVKSQHFTINSTLDEDDTITLLNNLEMFRQAVVIGGLAPSKSPVKNIVYAITDDQAKQLNITNRLGGYFSPSISENIMVLKGFKKIDDISTVLHDYVHYLNQSTSMFIPPNWLNEGVVEYYSDIRVRPQSLVIGETQLRYIKRLLRHRWYTAKKLLDEVNIFDLSRDKRKLFYTQSRLLVLYLKSRERIKSGEQYNFLSAVKKYKVLLLGGEDKYLAFEQAFNIELSTLNHKLRKHIRSERYRSLSLKKDVLLKDITVATKQLGKNEVAYLLAKLAHSRSESTMAKRWFDDAAAGEHPIPAALIGSALLTDDKQREQANQLVTKALVLAPRDFDVLLNAAGYYLGLALSDEQGSALFNRHIKKSRQLATRAWQINKDSPLIYFYFGMSYFLKGDDHLKAVQMLEEAHSVNPSNLHLIYALSNAYLRFDKAKSITLLKQILAMAHQKNEWQAMVEKQLKTLGEQQ